MIRKMIGDYSQLNFESDDKDYWTMNSATQQKILEATMPGSKKKSLFDSGRMTN
jgi:hypothetical protein